MQSCDEPQINIIHKQMSSLGDQNYPSFELRAVLAYLTEQGHEDWCLQQLTELDCTYKQLLEPFLPTHIALAGLKRVIRKFYTPGLGCDIAQTYCLSELGVIGACLGSANTLGDAMEISQNYHELLGSLTDIVNIVGEDSFTNRLVNVSQLEPELLQFLFELTVAGMVKMAEDISGKAIAIRCVRFSSNLSDEIRLMYSKRFNCHVEDNCKFNEWVIDLKTLNLPVINHIYSSMVANYNLKFLLYELNHKQGLVDEIDRILKTSVGDFPSSDMVSNILGMSGRTMRRRLNNMGINFSTLIDKVRCQRAINLIQNNNYSNEVLAEELGYSDAANFYNAFKKWTGKPPSFYRIESSE